MSRWMELKQLAAQVIALSSAFDADGVDIYFLNRPKVTNVKNVNQLDQVFQKHPTDYCLTPLSETLDRILVEQRQKFLNGHTVIVIATDGQPMSADASDSVQRFSQTLANRHVRVGIPSPEMIPVTILACTNDQRSVGYLNELDKDTHLYVDVCDDYQSESAELRDLFGGDFPFTLGDYTLKCLLGSSDAWLDRLDETNSISPAGMAYHKYGTIPPPRQQFQEQPPQFREGPPQFQEQPPQFREGPPQHY